MQSVYTTREKILLGTIAGYLLLNQGFTQLRIPPVGTGVPIGELVLVVALLGVSVPKFIGQLSRVLWALPFLLWWVYGISRSLAGMPQYGMWALRDASQVIDSLFFVLGFTLALNAAKLERFFHFFCWVFFFGAVYSLSYPAAKFLSAYSPHITSAGGYSVPILFSYVNAPMLLITSAVMLMLIKTPYAKGGMRFVWVALFLGISIGLLQSRTVYAQVIFVLVLLLIFQRKTFAKWTAVIACALLLILLVSASGIEMQGRLGKVSLNFMSKHFESMSGESDDQQLSGAASGVALRLGWWKKIKDELMQTPETLVFGLGYGMPLVNYTLGGGVRVREPHNSFISVTARLGVLGALLWIAMHITLFWTWLSGFNLARRRGWKVDETRLLVLMVFCSIILLASVGEDVMEKPFHVVPYYFVWGIIVAYVTHLRALAARGLGADQEPLPLGRAESDAGRPIPYVV